MSTNKTKNLSRKSTLKNKDALHLTDKPLNTGKTPNSPQVVQTRSKRSIATVNKPDRDNTNQSKRPKLDSYCPQRVAKGKKQESKVVQQPGVTESHQETHAEASGSLNNNTTIPLSNPVVGSTKSLIDNIKQIRKSKASKLPVLKEVTPAQVPPPKINNYPESQSDPPAQQPVAKQTASMKQQLPIGIQVTVNSSDDEYRDDEDALSLQHSDECSSSESSSEYTDNESSSGLQSTSSEPDSPKPGTSGSKAASKGGQGLSQEEFNELRDDPQFQQLVLEVLDKHDAQHYKEVPRKTSKTITQQEARQEG